MKNLVFKRKKKFVKKKEQFYVTKTKENKEENYCMK